MGWGGTDGWMDHPPAHQRIPFTILTSLPLLEKISLVSRPSWLHPCKERRKLREGRGEGKEQHLLRGGLGHIKFLFVRLVPVGKHPALWWQVRSCWSVVAFSTSLELW